MRSVLLVISLLALSASAFARSPLVAPCARGFHADSYGRGIEAGFKGQSNLRPQLVDEGCYLMGVRQGLNAHNETQIFDCDGQFDRGYARGFEASELSAGDACYNAGYQAGVAALDVGAREQNAGLVGESCVSAYNQGVADNVAGQIATLPTVAEPIASCYRLGYWDGKSAK